MKTYKQFIFETPEIDFNYDKKHALKPSSKFQTTSHNSIDKEHISTTKSGHKIYRVKKPGSTFRHYEAVKDGVVHQSVMGYDNSHDESKLLVGVLSGNPSTTIKAHEFYHHLITHHNISLESSQKQSRGGAKVWKNLSEMPGIKMIRNKNIHDINKDATYTRKVKIHKGKDWFKNYDPGQFNTSFTATKE